MQSGGAVGLQGCRQEPMGAAARGSPRLRALLPEERAHRSQAALARGPGMLAGAALAGARGDAELAALPWTSCPPIGCSQRLIANADAASVILSTWRRNLLSPPPSPPLGCK